MNTLYKFYFDLLEPARRLSLILTKLIGSHIDQILHPGLFVNVDELNKVVFPCEFDILKLSEVSNIESCAPMNSNLRLWVTSF